MRLAVAAVLALAALWGVQEQRLRAKEARLADVAAEIAGREVGISCPGFLTRLVEITPNSGWVRFDSHGRPGSKASLSADTCERLENVDDRSVLDERTAQAVVTLAHESFHLAGVTNEAQAQCYAVQTTELVAERLGVSPARARAAARWAAAASPLVLPREYWAAGACRDGGPWDLRPASSLWP